MAAHHSHHRRAHRQVVQNEVGARPLRRQPSHLEVLRRCLYITQVCRQYLLTRPSVPLHGARSMAHELESRLLTHDVEWSLVHADSNARQSLLDIAVVALAYATVAASEDPGTLGGVPAQDRRTVVGLQIKMRRMMNDFHLSDAHAQEVASEMPRLIRQCHRAILTMLSRTPELVSGAAPDAGGGLGQGSRFSDIDMHAEYENRATRLETSQQTSADGVAAKPKAPAAIALCPYRFVELFGRLRVNVAYQLYLIQAHHVLPPCDMGYDTCYQKIVELSTFTVTSGTEKLIQRYVGLDALPLGSLWSGVRRRNGQWNAMAVSQLVRDELGPERGNAVMDQTLKEARHVFAPHQAFVTLQERKHTADYQRPSWTKLHTQWALVFLARWMFAQVSEDPTPLYFVRRCDARRYREHVLATRHQLRHKRPLLLELCGSWYVQSVDVRYRLQLRPCPQGVLQAVACWAHTYLQKPYRGIDVRDVTLRTFLSDFVDPEYLE